MVQDKKIAQQRDRSNRGISRRIKNHKSDPSPASSTSAMFPAYERVVLREGEDGAVLIPNNPKKILLLPIVVPMTSQKCDIYMFVYRYVSVTPLVL